MFCPYCGKEFAPEANFCSACGKAPAYQANSPQPRIVRPRSPRVIAGVCSGFALHYGWDVNLTRVLFTVLTIFTFPIGLLLYLAAWIILPDSQYSLPQPTR
jgi:phage shock protein C